MFLGDYDAGSILDHKFLSTNTSATPTTLAGSPAASCYKSNSTTETTTGVTLTVDFDSRTGLNHVRVDTSADGTFYANGGQFEVVLTAGTVGGTSVVGSVLARFTLRAQAHLYPTTAGRTLDVSAGGDADAVVQSIANNAITAASIATDAITNAKIAADAIGAAEIADGAIDAATFAAGAINAAAIAADAIGASELAADAVSEIQAAIAAGAVASVTGNVGGNVTGSVGSVATGGITAASFASGAIDAAAIATDAIGSAELAASAVTEIQAAVAAGAVASVTGNVGGNVVGSVGSVATGGIVAASFAAGAIDAAAIATDAIGSAELAASAVTEIQAGLATQTSVDDLPTNAELATALAAADDAVLAAIAALNNLSQAQAQTAATAALNAYDGPTHAELTAELATADDAVLAAIAALNNLSAAQVNAEVVDVIRTDLCLEVTAVPPADATIAQMLCWVYALARNRILQTNTQQTLKADNGTTNIAVANVADNGTTAERSKWT